MKKIVIIAVFLIVNINIATKINAQNLGNDCHDAIILPLPAQTCQRKNFELPNQERWFSFVANSHKAEIMIEKGQKKPIAPLKKVSLYEGSCPNIVVLKESTTDSSGNIPPIIAEQLQHGKRYFIKVEREVINTGNFEICLKRDSSSSSFILSPCEGSIFVGIADKSGYVQRGYSNRNNFCCKATDDPTSGSTSLILSTAKNCPPIIDTTCISACLFLGLKIAQNQSTTLNVFTTYAVFTFEDGRKFTLSNILGAIYVCFNNPGMQYFRVDLYNGITGQSLDMTVNKAGILVLPNNSKFSVSGGNKCVRDNICFTPDNIASQLGFDIEYSWDFGDGTTYTTTCKTNSASNCGEICHKYNSAGFKTVTLKTFPACGNPYTKKIKILDPTPTFTYTKACAGQPIQFNGTSACSVSWLWKFGDGTTSTNQNPVKTYTTSGTYTVSLTVTKNGIAYLTTQSINVNPIPSSAFSGPAAACNISQYCVSSPTSGVIYSWAVNGGTPASGTGTCITVSWTNLTTGGSITMTATHSTSGCSSTTTKNVTPCACDGTVNYCTSDASVDKFDGSVTITGNVTWTKSNHPCLGQGDPLFIKGNLTIKSGAMLNISGMTIAFSPSSSIYIESGYSTINGGVLTLFNAILTGSGSCMWQGMLISGNSGFSQNFVTNLNDYNKHGRLVMFNSTVSHSYNGVTSQNGGIIEALSGLFSNNNTAVRFSSYNYPSASFLRMCKFVCDAPLRDTKTYLGDYSDNFLVMNGISDVTILDNEFINTPANATQSTIGINSVDAYYDITGKNKFNNMYRGIYALHTVTAVTNFTNHDFTGCIFDNVQNSIYISNSVDDRIMGNFINRGSTTADGVGIFMENCQGFMIAGNTITNTRQGVVVHESKGAFNSYVQKNEIDNVVRGVLMKNQNQALGVYCNNLSNYTTSGWHIFKASGGTAMLQDQGRCLGGTSGDFAAGNHFNVTANVRDISFSVGGQTSKIFKYYYDAVAYQTDISVKPDNTGVNVDVQGCSSTNDTLYCQSLIGLKSNSNSLLPSGKAKPTDKELIKLMVSTAVKEKQYNNARALLTDLNGSNLQPDKDFVKFHELMCDLGEQGKTCFEMDTMQLSIIREIATRKNEISANAEAVLTMVFGEEFPVTCEDVDECMDITASPVPNNPNNNAYNKTTGQDNAATFFENNIAIMPNPFNENTNISYSIAQSYQSAFIQITDIFGRIVESYQLRSNSGEIEFSATKLNKGIYICNLVVDEKTTIRKKMIMLK